MHASGPRVITEDNWTIDVEGTPLYDLEYPFNEHADISYFNNGERFVFIPNETLPNEVKLMAEKLTKGIKCYIDQSPDTPGCPNFKFVV